MSGVGERVHNGIATRSQALFSRRASVLTGGCLVALTACGSAVDSAGSRSHTTDAPVEEAVGSVLATTNAPVSVAPTSTVPEELDVHDPRCVVVVQSGESLSLIADRFDDDTVYPASIRAENEIGDDVIHLGDQLDICVDNGIDDITGETRTEPNAAIAAAVTQANVRLQQAKLNELFAGYGTAELSVDGISGSVTRQRLCAARVTLGLLASTADMVAGSEEEQLLMTAGKLEVPVTTTLESERWILIDQTCQMMFVGQGSDQLTYVFATSTGEPGHETRPQDRTRAFRFDPALDNNGWHDSTDFPVAIDNPLNGNMYKPVYFDGGQAIHGANNVPTNPQSKGCARLRVEHQDLLVGWLGLTDAPGPTNDSARIDLTVTVQGAYLPS